MFILNYSNNALSEDILEAILKINEPPKIISNEASGWTYWTYENRRCAIVMVQGDETMKPYKPIYYGSRYFIFHALLKDNVFMKHLNSGTAYILDKAYHILYNQTAIEIYHKNFFTNQTIQLDPHKIHIVDDLKNLNGRKLRLTLPDGNHVVTTFDVYLGETIAQQRNGSFELVQRIDDQTDYGVVNIGVPFLGTDKILALGSTFISVFVPRSKPKPIIAVLIDPFDCYTWMLLFVTTFGLALVLSLFGKVLQKQNILEVVIELIMCALGGPSRHYGGWLENLLITHYCLMISIVIVSSYQSLIISYLSYARYYPEINTADQIRNNCIFPLQTVFAGHLNLQTFETSQERPDNMCYLFASRDNPHITSLLVKHTRAFDRSARKAYDQNLRIADTTFFKFHLLYYFFNKSLIRELFPFYISAFYESGLFDQYYKNKSNSELQYQQEHFINRSFNIADLSIIWFLYLGGVTVSTIWFFVELISYKSQIHLQAFKTIRCKGYGNKMMIRMRLRTAAT